jgi:hypothetical protein
MRYSPSSIRHAVAGAVLAVGVTWLGFLAAADDDYYQDSVSRWEHATRGGRGPVALVVVGMTLAAGFALACLVRGFLPRRVAFALPILLVVPAYLIAWWMAWFGLAGGH